jgi:DNA repair exonuclease SbcCD ATPase subunit
MKKLIILLMAVSIMLTSCGKSSGLSNRNKGADNKTLSATGTDRKKLPQGTNYKNSKNVSKIDTIKRHLHTVSDFFSAHKAGVVGTLVLLISTGLAYYYRYEIARWFLKKEIADLTKKNEDLSKQIKALPKPTPSDKDKQITALKAEANKLRDDNKILEERNKLQEGAIKQYKEDYNILFNTNEKNVQIIKQFESEKKSLDTISRLEKSNEEQLNKIGDLEKSNQEQLDVIDRLVNKNSDKSDKIDQLEMKNQEQVKMIDQNEHQIADLLKQNQEQLDRISELEQAASKRGHHHTPKSPRDDENKT